MSRPMIKQLISPITRTADPIFDNGGSTLPEEETTTPFFFISDYMYGGCLTFTAHLLHTLNGKEVFRIAKRFERKKKKKNNFGYGIRYQNVPLEYFDTVQNVFITDMYQHSECLENLKRRKGKGREVTIVIHDPGEVFKFNEPYLKYWNIITIRKSMQQYLRDRYGIESKFIYHSFYPYLVEQQDDGNDDGDEENKTQAVSISRIDFNKNIEIILDANKRARNNPVKIYGWANGRYVSERLDTDEFNQYYQGKYVKSFDATSEILKKAKFMVDLSFLPNDGGGTQYTFLDAIYHNCAIILNRQWIENVDPRYRDFKEGENCYAVSNAEELKELLDDAENMDTSKIVQNARKLLDRHINAGDWNKEIISLQHA
jgi:glycosyltransferase involved in cell wall biosynthesis